MYKTSEQKTNTIGDCLFFLMVYNETFLLSWTKGCYVPILKFLNHVCLSYPYTCIDLECLKMKVIHSMIIIYASNNTELITTNMAENIHLNPKFKHYYKFSTNLVCKHTIKLWSCDSSRHLTSTDVCIQKLFPPCCPIPTSIDSYTLNNK